MRQTVYMERSQNNHFAIFRLLPGLVDMALDSGF